MRYLYDHGLPFSQDLATKALDPINKLIVINKAAIVIIDGNQGEGKTTLGIEISDYMANEQTDLSVQYAMGGLKFQEKLNLCYAQGKKTILYDEAGDFSRRSALTDFNKNLIRVFETFRVFKIIPILMLPNFAVLDNSLFDMGVPRLLLHCENRTLTQGNFRAYDRRRMAYIKKVIMPKMADARDAFNLEIPNFRGHFLDLPPERQKELEELTKKGKEKIVMQQTIKSRSLITVPEIAIKLNRSVQWVQQKIWAKSIKPTEQIGRRYYYEPTIAEKLIQ